MLVGSTTASYVLDAAISRYCNRNMMSNCSCPYMLFDQAASKQPACWSIIS